MATTRWAALPVLAMLTALAAGCRGASPEGRAARVALERPQAAVESGTTGSVAESNLVGRADPFVPYGRFVYIPGWRLPPEPPRLPGQRTAAVVGPPLPVGDDHWRRAAGVLWDTVASAIYERDEEAFVVAVGDMVGTRGEQETVVAIGRDSLIVRGADNLRRRVPLERRSRPGWYGIIEH